MRELGSFRFFWWLGGSPAERPGLTTGGPPLARVLSDGGGWFIFRLLIGLLYRPLCWGVLYHICVEKASFYRVR